MVDNYYTTFECLCRRTMMFGMSTVIQEDVTCFWCLVRMQHFTPKDLRHVVTQEYHP